MNPFFGESMSIDTTNLTESAALEVCSNTDPLHLIDVDHVRLFVGGHL